MSRHLPFSFSIVHLWHWHLRSSGGHVCHVALLIPATGPTLGWSPSIGRRNLTIGRNFSTAGQPVLVDEAWKELFVLTSFKTSMCLLCWTILSKTDLSGYSRGTLLAIAWSLRSPNVCCHASLKTCHCAWGAIFDGKSLGSRVISYRCLWISLCCHISHLVLFAWEDDREGSDLLSKVLKFAAAFHHPFVCPPLFRFLANGWRGCHVLTFQTWQDLVWAHHLT